MNKTEKIFINLLAQSIFHTNKTYDEVLTKDDIEGVIQLSVQHVCQGYIFKSLMLNQASIPDNFKLFVKQLVYRNYSYFSIQSEVIQKLKDNNIPCIVLKGSSVSMNYDDPMYRILGDIDILVRETDYDKAIDIFLDGKEQSQESNKHKFHYRLEYKNYTVEIHRYITKYDSEKDELRQIFDNAFDKIEIGHVDVFEFPSLCNKYQTLCLLFHFKRHLLKNNSNVRMLTDYLVFADKISADEWNDSIYPLLKILDIDIFADALFMLSDMYFGTNNSQKIHNRINDGFVSELIDEIVESGINDSSEKLANDFGLLENNNDKKSNMHVIITTLNSLSKKNFKIAKYSVTLPICWSIIVLRYLFRTFLKKRAKISLKQINQSINRKNDLYDVLKFRNDNKSQ